MSRSAWRQPVRIADAIPGALQRLGLESRFRQSEIWAVWPTVAGPQIARHAQPHAVWHGRLIVHVTDPVWLHHLSMMRPRLIAALNERLRTSTVRELIFRLGAVAAPLAIPPSRPEPTRESPPAPGRIVQVEAILAPLGDAPFREALQRLLLSAFRSADSGPSR